MTPAARTGQTSGLPEITTVLLGVTAFVLGVVGISTNEPQVPILDVGYRALQLFVLDGGALPNGVGSGWLLQVARLLAPLSLALAFIVGFRTLLSERWRSWRTERRDGHVLVCGDGDPAMVLAGNIAEDGRHVVLVRSGVAGSRAGFVRSAAGEARRKSTVVGDPRDPAALHAAGILGAAELYACGGTGAANAAVALSAVRLRSALRSQRSARRLLLRAMTMLRLRAPARPPLVAFAEMNHDGPTEVLGVRSEGTDEVAGFALDFFTVADVAAARLLDLFPVGRATPVVHGLGALGQAVVGAMVRARLDAAPGGTPQPRTIVISGSDEADVGRLEEWINALARGYELRAGTSDDADGRTYVCLPDEDAAVAAALRLARTGHDAVLCLPQASPIREVLVGEAGLHVFGVLDEACRADAIREASTFIGRMARAIHQGYVDDAKKRNETEATNPSMVPWASLPTHLKQSNIAQAEHLREKLRKIDATLTTRRPVPFEMTEAEVQELAELEHERWMAERMTAGFVWGPDREGHFHPDLVEWSDLPAKSREKDVNAVHRLPELLAAEGLYLTRMKAGGTSRTR